MTSAGFSVATERIVRRRLNNQLLSAPTRLQACEIVARLGAVQAQDYAGAKWAIGLRAGELTELDVDRAFDEGTILRTHVLRPTWHFVAPADIRWMLDLTGPRIKSTMAYHRRTLGLDDQMLRRGTRAIERALRDGGRLTRADLGVALKRAGLEASGQRYAYVIMHAELDGLICSGSRQGRQMTYTLLEKRVPPARTYGHDEAVAELAVRYFSSHGPATPADFAWWSGLTLREARTGIEIAASTLVASVQGGVTYWDSRAPSVSARRTPKARLLPNWDEYVVAYRHRDILVRPGLTGGLLSNTVLIGGRIAGAWRRSFRRDRVIIEVVPGVGWSAAERAQVDQAAEEYGAFLQRPVSLSIR
jgi:hypothetical protein